MQPKSMDVTRAPMKRDTSDLEKLTRFFTTNSPFRHDDVFRLVSLSTSIAPVEADKVTCDRADKIGIVTSCANGTTSNTKIMMLPKSDTVRTLLDVYNTYKFHDGHMEIDANILFHRLVVLAQQQANVAEHFAYMS